ncbi:hypothetical protein ACFVI5_12600 [Streptomyces albogriseolus]|uniref:hypothetical protein n=1 Tax=Streptomyces albogriseolus TaxID=1887 RepID=UPI00363AFA9F
MGVSVARISQIDHGEGATLDVIARYVEALGRGLRRPHPTHAGQRQPGQCGGVVVSGGGSGETVSTRSQESRTFP